MWDKLAPGRITLHKGLGYTSLKAMAPFDIDMKGDIYRVKVQDWVNGKPQAGYRLVIASDKESALDKVSQSEDVELYDEPIQRGIVNGEISDHRVERKYPSYIEGPLEYIE